MHRQANFTIGTLEYGIDSIVLGRTHLTLQAISFKCPLHGVSGFKADHMTGLWVWSSSWGGMKMGLPCAHL